MSTVRCSTRRRRERCGAADAGAFDNRVDGVGGDILERLDLSAWPANLDRFHLRGGAQAEVQTQIVLREVACATADFAELFNTRGTNRYTGADCSAVALRADELEEDAMIAAGVFIFEKRRRLAHVQEKDVNVAGVEDVAESSAPAGMKRQSGKAGFLGDFVEGAVAIVAMKGERLTKAGAGFQSVDLRVNVAVGDENVEPGVIVHVEKSGAPADVGIAGLTYSRCPTDIVETLRTGVAIEGIGLLLEVRDEEAEAAAVVVITPIDAHVAELHAFAAESHAGEHAHVGEGAVVIVMVEIVGDGVVSDEEIGPAIVIVVHPHDPEAVVADVIVDAGLDGDVFELAVAETMIKGTAAEAGDEEIELAVIIVIGDGYAHAPTAAGEARFLGDVLESAVALLVIEGDERVAAGAVSLDGGTVDEDDVEAAVVVAIEEADAAAGGVNDIVGFGSGDVDGRETHIFGDIFENRHGWQTAAVFLPLRRALRRWRDRHRDTLRSLCLCE